MEPELINLYLDESRVESIPDSKLVVCAVAVVDRLWGKISSLQRDFRSGGMGSRLQRIAQLLEDANGIAVLTSANIDKRLLPPGEVDSTNDIPRMSRTDNAWSICFLFCIATCAAILRKAGLSSFDLNVYHDPKSLTKEHWLAIQQSIRFNIVKASMDIAEIHGSRIDHLCIKKIEEVQKAKRGETPDPRQAGVAVADYLCSKVNNLVDDKSIPQKKRRIFIRDHTKTVVSTLAEIWPIRSEPVE
jgi:hypothetical protein